jgi:hypothetical protein
MLQIFMEKSYLENENRNIKKRTENMERTILNYKTHTLFSIRMDSSSHG